MAWDDHTFRSRKFLSGDKPFDEMTAAVNRISRAFLDRFGRLPYLVELLYPLLFVAEGCVADGRIPELDEFAGLLEAVEHVEPGSYEAGFTDENQDFVISRSGKDGGEVVVVRGWIEDDLFRYEILDATLTDRMAHALIRDAVLVRLMRRNAEEEIRFERAS